MISKSMLIEILANIYQNYIFYIMVIFSEILIMNLKIQSIA